ncbi:MAG: polysaccharide deacetylase family protein [Candidatus Paceibacterota bacterium]
MKNKKTLLKVVLLLCLIFIGFFLLVKTTAAATVPQSLSHDILAGFSMTELVSDNSDSIEFWTQATCPGISKYGYQIPDGYKLISCASGGTGTHSGCPGCLMSKIKLALEKIIEPVDGECGSSDGNTFSAKPTTNLCAKGISSPITGNGPWSWMCIGANGGSIDTCSAAKTVPTPQPSTCTIVPGFSMTDLASDDLPSSIEFWTQATCPGSNSYAYQVPSGYELVSCSHATMGSHCGCSDCVMSKIKLTKTQTPTPPTPINGYCGSSDGNTFSAKPTTNLCAKGSSSIVSGSGPWNWTCAGINGGSTDSCSANKTQTTTCQNPIVGVSGSTEIQSGQFTTLNATATSPSGNSLTYSWTCTSGQLSQKNILNPTYYAPSVSSDRKVNCNLVVSDNKGCHASGLISITVKKNSPTAKNGVCGSSNGQTFTSKPSTNLCSYGNASSVSGSGPWNWTCAGTNGGNNISCSANKTATPTPVNGECGSSDGNTFSAKPTTNLCAKGTASTVSGSGPWNWTCAGTNGGSTDSCSANKTATPATPKGMISINFDDGWLSAYNNALPILNRAGLKSTQYIITTSGLNDSYNYVNASQVLTMQSAGHEIGAHSRTHADLIGLSTTQLQSEINGSRQDLLSIGVNQVNTFAYPFGDVDSTVESATRSAGFTCARGVESGFNTKDTNPYILKSRSLENNTSITTIKGWIDDAIKNDTWEILVIHQVVNNGGQYSITPATMQQIVDYLVQKNVTVVTNSEGMRIMSQK